MPVIVAVLALPAITLLLLIAAHLEGLLEARPVGPPSGDGAPAPASPALTSPPSA